MLRFTTLGTVDIQSSEQSGCGAVLNQPKRTAFLIYLAVEARGTNCRREDLLSVFWPDLDNGPARNALSQGLSFLRKHLPSEAFLLQGQGEIGLDPSSTWVDVTDFRLAIKEGRWGDAIDLYGGDFLRGFHLKRPGRFDFWVSDMQAELRSEATGAAWSLAESQLNRGAVVEGMRTGQKALMLSVPNESQVCRFLGALVDAAGRVEAVQFFERFRDQLHHKLEMAPSPEALSLIQRIRDGGAGASDSRRIA